MFRNMLKKITSVALAFALIGAGSAIGMKNNPQESALHTAHAISRAQCRNHGQYTTTKINNKLSYMEVKSRWGGLYTDYYNHVVYDVCCASCGNYMYSYERVSHEWRC